MTGLSIKDGKKGMVVYKVVSPELFNLDYCEESKTSFFTVLDPNKTVFSGVKNIIFNDANKSIYIYDDVLDLEDVLIENNVSVDHLNVLKPIGEVIVIPLDGYTVKLPDLEKIYGKEVVVEKDYNYYESIRDVVLEGVDLGVEYVYLNHSLRNKRKLLSELKIYESDLRFGGGDVNNEKSSLLTISNENGALTGSFVNLANSMIEIKNGRANKVSDFINLKGEFKSISSSFQKKVGKITII